MSAPRTERIIGTLSRTAEGKGVVRMEDVFDTEIADLWSALTEPGRLVRWIGEVNGDMRLGGRIYARFTSTWEGPGRIDVCEAPHHLAVTMEPGSSDETVIEAMLTADGARTRLVISERGLPAGELAAHGAGWQAHVEDLAAHIEGREKADWRTRWLALSPAYQDLGAGLA